MHPLVRGGGYFSPISHAVINSLTEEKRLERSLPFPCPAAAGRGRNICPLERGGGGKGFWRASTQRKPIFSTKRGMT